MAQYATVELGQIASVKSGYSFKSADWTVEGTPVIKIQNVRAGRVDPVGCSFVSSETASVAERYRLRDGDILVTMSGEIGSIGLVRGSNGWMLNQRVGRIDVDAQQCEPLFVYYALLDPRIKSEMEAVAYGAAQPNISPKLINALVIPLPPLLIQRRIANILSAYDELIEYNTRRIKILEEMAQSIYKEWFVNFRYPGHENVPLVDSPLGPIPTGWRVEAASKVIEIGPRVAVDRSVPIAFVPMGSLSETQMHIGDVETRSGSSGAKFSNGDTLFARITPCLENGKTAYVQFLDDGQSACGSTEFIVMRSRSVSSGFVYLLARSDEFRGHAIASMSGATGRQRVRNECFDSYLLAVPPTDLLEDFEAMVQQMFRLSYQLFRTSRTLRLARDLILPKLLSGDVVLPLGGS